MIHSQFRLSVRDSTIAIVRIRISKVVLGQNPH